MRTSPSHERGATSHGRRRLVCNITHLGDVRVFQFVNHLVHCTAAAANNNASEGIVNISKSIRSMRVLGKNSREVINSNSDQRENASLRQWMLSALLVALALLTAACGGGGGGSSSGATTPATPQQTRSVSGEAIKGTIRNGRVALFAISGGAVASTAFANGTTDKDGHFAIDIPTDRSGPAVIEVTAAPSGTTPATTMLCDHTAGCGHAADGTAIAFGDAINLDASFRLRAVVADIASANLESVSFFTDLAAATVVARTDITADVIRQANDSVRDLFGLSDDITHIDNVDLSVTHDISGLTAVQRRAALLSAGAMGALIANASGDAGAALGAALDRARQHFVAEDGQLIANEGDLDDVGVSYSDILKSTLQVADDSRVVVGAVTDLRAEAERVAQLPVGQRTDGKASPGFSGTERGRAVAFVTDVRNAVTTFSDPTFKDEAVPESVRTALDFAAKDAANAAKPLSQIAMAVVDAVQRFRDGEPSPVVSNGVSVTLSTDASNDRTKFDVDRTDGDLHVVMGGSTKGAFKDLDVVDHLKSTAIELDLTAKVNAPGLSGEITEGKVTARYSEMFERISVADIVRQLPGVVLIPQLANSGLDTRNTALASLQLSLKLKLQQTAATGLDPLALEANLKIDGADIAKFHRDTSTQFNCPAYSNPIFALSRCSTFDQRDGLRFDALRVTLGATVTSASGRLYRAGIAADLNGTGTEFTTADSFAQTAVVQILDLATAVQLFGPVVAAQGTQFCCFTPTNAPLQSLLSPGPRGLVESETAFLGGSISMTLETNVAPLSPRTVFSASLERKTFNGAASDVSLDFGGRALRAHLTTDTLQDGKNAVANVAMNSQDGARFTGRYDGASKTLLDGVLTVNGHTQAHLEQRGRGVIVFVFENGEIVSLN